MSIEVGSKWFEPRTKCFVFVLAVSNGYVVYEYGKNALVYSILDLSRIGAFVRKQSNFLEDFTPHQDNVEWVKLNKITFERLEGFENLVIFNLNDYEVLFNYNRYRKQFDNVELGWEKKEKIKYLVVYDFEERNYCIKHTSRSMYQNALYFSTREHARSFIKLLIEKEKNQ